MTKNIIGIIWILLYVLCVVFLGMYSRVLSRDFSLFQISFVYNVAALIIVLPFVIKRRSQLMKNSVLWYCVLRALCIFLAQVLTIIAYNNIPFAQVAAISITYPLFSTLAAVIFLNEKVCINLFLALMIGFIGAGITVNPSLNDFNYYSLFVIASILLWVAFDIITNKIGDRENIWDQILLIILFIGLFSIFPIFGSNWPNMHDHNLILFFLIGVIVVLYMLSITWAVAKAEVSIVTPFYFTVLPISSLVAYFIFDEKIKMRIILGAAIIFISVIYMAFRDYRAKKMSENM